MNATRILLPLVLSATAAGAMAQPDVLKYQPTADAATNIPVVYEGQRTRAEVAAEAAAPQTGVLAYQPTANAETNLYTAVPSQVSRAQVVAELQEAQRLGLIRVGDNDYPAATPEQTEQIRQAGLRAVQGNPVVQAGGASQVKAN